jgi:hypothetical protein
MAEKHDGYSASSLVTQVRESPSRPGILWIGTDDGNLQVSKDDGETFTNVYPNITGAPKGWVQISRIEPSHYDPGTAYVALDNHRNDDWKPYLFKTTDYGLTWTNVAGNLPAKGNINALREDMENPNLLWVGTEFGLYVTMNQGEEWKKFMTGLPNVRIDDILIHPRDRDLIVASHGRSIWICDDISALEQWGDATKMSGNKDVILFDPRPAILWKNDPQAQRHVKNVEFVGHNPQGGTAITVWAKSDMGTGKLEFLQNNKVMSTMDIPIKAGMNRVQWAMRGPVPAEAAGGGRGGRGGRGGAEAAAGNAPAAGGGGFGGGGGGGRGRGSTGVPFVAGGGRGGGGGGGFGGFGAVAQGPLLEPGTYFVRLTVGSETITSSVDILDDIWMRPQ